MHTKPDTDRMAQSFQTRRPPATAEILERFRLKKMFTGLQMCRGLRLAIEDENSAKTAPLSCHTCHDIES